MSEEIYYRAGIGDEVLLDPASLNLDELPMALAMSGWMAIIDYPETDGGDISLQLADMGAVKGKSEAEVALSLGIIDSETGELLPGYSVSGQGARVEVRYKGVADLRFAEFVKVLHGLSPWA